MRTFIFFVMLYVSALPTGIAKPQDIDCVVDKYGQYAATQEEWQRDLTKLVLSSHPQFAEVANLYLEDQLTMIELRRIAADFIAWQTPDKLNLAAPVNQWVSLDTLILP